MLQLEYKGPRGKMVLRTLAMPSNVNINGNIFGGWIMSQMDMAGAILAKKIAGGKVVTINVNNMTFLKPMLVGDLVSCYAQLVKIGNSSITINIEVWVKKISAEPLGNTYQTAKSVFVFVAIDNEGHSRTILVKK